MRELSRDELLQAILATAEKHPNARISKLIKCVEVEKNQKNIVLLLIELAEQPEVSSDESISLKYYLDLFEELSEEPSFAEAGLLLLNSAIIYGKRVDNVHLTVERLILSLINTENVEEEREESEVNLNSESASKNMKRGKKRPLEQLKGPYEADMSTKRFKVMSNNKRFEEGPSSSNKRGNNIVTTQLKDSIASLSTDFTHPTIWKYSTIEDFDYDDEIDFKKNYKLFTYHLEHRYNTLIPDINFKMYFKIKDYIDAECRDSNNSELWPPLSDAYIEHYVNLENQILHNEGHDAQNQYSTEERMRINNIERIKITMQSETVGPSDLQLEDSHEFSEPVLDKNCNAIEIGSLENSGQLQSTDDNSIQNTDSGIDLDSSIINSSTESSNSLQTNEELSLIENDENHNTTANDSGIQCGTVIESQSEENATETELCANKSSQDEPLTESEHDPTLLDPKYDKEDLTTIKVILPHLDDEGVFFSDLDERDQQMLSPAVVATDVFRCIKDKSNIVVIVDDVIKKIYNIQEPKQQVLSLPVYSSPGRPLLPLNILKVSHKYFKKRRVFKLGSEFHMLKKERHKKYLREQSNQQAKQSAFPRTRVRLDEDVTGVPLSPPSSPSYEPDFYGFPEEVPNDKNRTLSRDSGISLQQIEVDTDVIPELGSIDLEKTLDANETSGELLSTEETVNMDDASQQIEQTNCNPPAAENEDLDELNEICQEIDVNENLASKMTKVQEWHAHLQPILAQSRDRHHFDVFALGTEILSQFDRHDINSKLISLNHVMENKDRSLISRYFLSTLLLANQGNISIDVNNRSSELPSELNEVELRLLSTKRNVVSLEDNIGLRASQILIERPMQETFFTKIRTLKPVPSIPPTEDHDSGISMSDGCST